jgi:hypothetical protein
VLAAVAFVSPTAHGAADEYEVKAALIYKISKFVRWPEIAVLEASGTLRLCIVGEDNFGDSIDSLKGKRVQGLRILIDRLPTDDQAVSGCQIAFISRSEQQRLPALLKKMEGSAALTISDIEGFAAGGGMLDFATTGGKISFRINPAASRRAGIEISSQLLQLATLVGDPPVEAKR